MQSNSDWSEIFQRLASNLDLLVKQLYKLQKKINIFYGIIIVNDMGRWVAGHSIGRQHGYRNFSKF